MLWRTGPDGGGGRGRRRRGRGGGPGSSVSHLDWGTILLFTSLSESRCPSLPWEAPTPFPRFFKRSPLSNTLHRISVSSTNGFLGGRKSSVSPFLHPCWLTLSSGAQRAARLPLPSCGVVTCSRHPLCWLLHSCPGDLHASACSSLRTRALRWLPWFRGSWSARGDQLWNGRSVERQKPGRVQSQHAEGEGWGECNFSRVSSPSE